MVDDKIDTVEYIERMIDLYNDNDIEGANALKEGYGKQEVTLEDVEEATAYILSNVSAVLLSQEAFHEVAMENLYEQLVDAEVITKDEKEKAMGHNMKLKEKIKGNIINDREEE